MIVRESADLHGMRRAAWFSDCERYRYWLGIQLLPTARPRRVTFVMLNPSTATEEKNDPTVAKCSKYARQWGFHFLDVVNLFALRSTDPAWLYKVDDPIGPENNAIIRLNAMAADLVVCAWGTDGAHLNRGASVRAFLPADRLHYLKLTKVHPHHPLYLRGDLQPTKWEAK